VSLASRFVRSGKVRDLYRLGDGRLLLVASDRLSAFDVVLPTPIPDKGLVLTGLSRFWFAETARIVPNHLVGTDPDELPGAPLDGRQAVRDRPRRRRDRLRALRGRMMICRELDILPVEVIVAAIAGAAGGPTATRASCAGSASRPICAKASGCPIRSSPRPRRRRPANTTRTSRSPR
jgi:phosphoribosylaminoimidazole-succinocarboxamide synthase